MKLPDNPLGKDADLLTGEDMLKIVQLVACEVRRNGIPARDELASAAGDFKELLHESPGLEK